jgi:hypothetical protein
LVCWPCCLLVSRRVTKGHTRARVLRAVGAEGIAGPAPLAISDCPQSRARLPASLKRRMGGPLDVAVDIAADDGIDPDNALARDEAVRAAVSRFLELAPAQRSCLILKDVLDYSLAR